MAERAPSEASNVKLAENQRTVIARVLGVPGKLDEWMSCKRCGCGALAHGYDEPSQSCLCGKCAGYRCRL